MFQIQGLLQESINSEQMAAQQNLQLLHDSEVSLSEFQALESDLLRLQQEDASLNMKV